MMDLTETFPKGSDVSATKGECRPLSVRDTLDDPDRVSDSLLENAKLSAQKPEFVGGLKFVAHCFGAVICDEVFHSENDKPLTQKSAAPERRPLDCRVMPRLTKEIGNDGG